MSNKFCQDSEVVNLLKSKKGISPILVKGVDSLRSQITGELEFTIGVYYADKCDESLTMILSLWLDYEKDLLSQAEDLIRLTRKGKKQSKVGIAISTFVQ